LSSTGENGLSCIFIPGTTPLDALWRRSPSVKPRESFAELGAQVIGVSKDSPESHRQFADRHTLSILLLSDPGHQVIEAYQSWKEKTMYGKKILETQRDTFLIDPDGRIVSVWRKVSPKGHADEVKKALKNRSSV